MKASARHRKKASCASLRRKAKRIDNRRKRKKALKHLPARCAKPKPPKAPVQTTIPAGTQPAATQVAPPTTGTPTPAAPAPAPPGPVTSPIALYSGTFGPRQAERLLWRAGFGPRPEQAAQLAALGLQEAVVSLTRPSGAAVMEGPEPSVDDAPLDPYNEWGHDHLWWLDRMVRSQQSLVERMALVWHDWFSTSDAGVGSREFMLEQNNLFRNGGLGNFKDLVRAITQDKAMQVWLSALDNKKKAINENYGRELMELFTLGADRGAYTETDVRELARSLSGFTATWDSDEGLVDFRFSTTRWDSGQKTVFGNTGAFNWEDAARMVVEHAMHPSFFVTKLWGYFIADPIPDATRDALAAAYADSGYEIRPIVEAILCAPQLYTGGAMVKPPVVMTAGLLRATGQGIVDSQWVWMDSNAGQQLFYPPDVSGWDDARWLDTNTMAGRWELVNGVLGDTNVQPSNTYKAETAAEAIAAARASLNDPPLTAETESAITGWANDLLPAKTTGYQRAQRYNALRQLIAMSPDHQTS
ncbi:MAG: hypothetical protein QOF76_1751 [Solirubrobacteraceae bacterium]|nr:hypothetical protein [Solirubrobacteraceae bacterium]